MEPMTSTPSTDVLDSVHFNPPFRVFLKTFGITSCAVSIVFNTLAITAIIKARLDKRYINSILVVNQSFADLLCGLTAQMGYILNNISEQDPEFDTQPYFFIYAGAATLTFITSLGNTFLIGLERFIATKKYLTYKTIVTRRKVFVGASLMWTVLSLLIITPLYINISDSDTCKSVFRTLMNSHAYPPSFYKDELIVGSKPTIYRISFALVVIPSYVNTFMYMVRQKEYWSALRKLFRRRIRVGVQVNHRNKTESSNKKPSS
ncbi:hypothetical protein CAPTEDRAFT_201227 [Capitella teleta]|uniref:G-protein coupled receptors family 1 profile domain-containing protein n=1 Tax=Capitella teleta TaxID=283909 RepID=R7VM67_CAPTE|nr:hypothetical protein CAPTEDRAFT_201227 [Capitella teleta]|eukprot:ELU18310.1 hypothetical protein CAPTEDRAFT_201227 [Capitella teleta]